MPVLDNLRQNANSFLESTVTAGGKLAQGGKDFLINVADQVAPGLRNLVKKPVNTLSAVAPLRTSIINQSMDWRCKISWAHDRKIAGGVLDFLQPSTVNEYTVIWPYTPDVTINYQTNYEMVKTLQTNYSTPAYQSSEISTININGTFTAGTAYEANYLYAVMHFFKSATKGYNVENNQLAGSPPPILNLSYMGDSGINKMPVVITTFNIIYPKDVDYIQTNFSKFRYPVPTLENEPEYKNFIIKEAMVPTEIMLMLTVAPSYNRNKLAAEEYSTTRFVRGELLDKGFF